MRENYDYLIKRATYDWRYDRDFEDLKQELYIHLMEFPDEWSTGRCVVLLRFRAIDWLRKRDGRVWRDYKHTNFGLGEVFEPVAKEIDIKPSILLGLSGREAVIADLWYEGWAAVDFNEKLGITPSRVSQILSDIRKKVKRMEELDRLISADELRLTRERT